MTEKEYREHPAVRRSELFWLTESPEKFKYNKDHPPEPTPALLFGQVFHKYALDAEHFSDEFAILPEVDRRTKAGREELLDFAEANRDKTLITEEMFRKALAMTEALLSYPLAVEILKGFHEVPLLWTDELTGEPCKCRADVVRELPGRSLIVDLKTAQSARGDAFMRDALKHGYDLQAGMYTEGYRQVNGRDCDFVFLVVEKEPPYAVNIFQADELLIRRGRDLFRELIGIYHECRKTDYWYGYLGKYAIINKLNLPNYLAAEVQ